ncbi:putative F-box protein At3g10430 isoform X2 [Apium graveolens]|uniref:putative F-box protein At3g10430 isoform X2 n=1 Tax=Apium graveolens TaxID=4045 RepID=UPI003D7AF98D
MVKSGKTKKKYHKPTKPHHHLNPPPAQANKPISVKTLPAHLVLEILYRTPVKSLVRFKSVSKSWFALINHPTFIKMHLDFNTSKNDKNKLICSCGYGTFIDIALLSLSEEPMNVLRINKDFTERPNYPRKINFRDFSKNMVLAGSVNGIVCLSHSEEMSERFVVLWNPSICCWCPIALVETKSWDNMSVGIGFDEVINDYKVICIVPEFRFEDYGWSRIEVYSTNQGSWEDVDKKGKIHFRPNTDLNHCNFIVNGVPYWAGLDLRPGYVDVLGRIDPFTGLFKKIEHPKHVRNEITRVNPVKLRESVAALIQSPGDYPNNVIDLYLLDENTTKWTKMYSIGPLVSGNVCEEMQIPQCFSTGIASLLVRVLQPRRELGMH